MGSPTGAVGWGSVLGWYEVAQGLGGRHGLLVVLIGSLRSYIGVVVNLLSSYVGGYPDATAVGVNRHCP